MDGIIEGKPDRILPFVNSGDWSAKSRFGEANRSTCPVESRMLQAFASQVALALIALSS
jgi:hypothetical protein